MTITIKIKCDTISEFYSHLTKIQLDIKVQTKRLKLDPLRDDFNRDVRLDDDNCYGEHIVTIKN